MPRALFTTIISASSYKMSSGMSSGAAIIDVGSDSSTVITSPARNFKLFFAA